MNAAPYTPQRACQDAVQANLARIKSVRAGEPRKADYYEGQQDAYTHVMAAIAGITFDQAADQVFDALEDLERQAK